MNMSLFNMLTAKKPFALSFFVYLFMKACAVSGILVAIGNVYL